MRILRVADHKRMPWKNGGGETVEIAVFPDGAGLEDFDWRISMARVDGSGPFSSFPGIDRTLAILEGEGLILDVAGHPSQRLTQYSEPHAFPADAITSAELIGGPVVDFNVMSRRGRLAHRVTRSNATIASQRGTLRLVLCASGSVDLIHDSRTETLFTKGAAIVDMDATVELIPSPGSVLYLVDNEVAG